MFQAKDSLDILYEDENLLVINKPAGLSIHRSPKEPHGTLADMLVEYEPALSGVGEDPDRPGIVHRLDKETSGVLVVAKQQGMFLTLKELFQQRRVEKRYLALVDGRIKTPRGVIEYPIGRYGMKRVAILGNPSTSSGSISRSRSQGSRAGNEKALKVRDAKTAYIVRRRFVDATLVELLPKTGRMHQLRVHMQAIGHPILGDKLYGGKRVAARALRQMLHAAALSFSVGDRRYLFEVDPPEDFQGILQSLEEYDTQEKLEE